MSQTTCSINGSRCSNVAPFTKHGSDVFPDRDSEIRTWLADLRSLKRQTRCPLASRYWKDRIADSKSSRNSPWAWEFHPLKIKILLESNPPKSRILLRRSAVPKPSQKEALPSQSVPSLARAAGSPCRVFPPLPWGLRLRSVRKLGIVDPVFPELHPLNLRVCLSQTLRNPHYNSQFTD